MSTKESGIRRSSLCSPHAILPVPRWLAASGPAEPQWNERNRGEVRNVNLKLSDEIAVCLRRAAEERRFADRATHPELREAHLAMEREWARRANSYRVTDQLFDYLKPDEPKRRYLYQSVHAGLHSMAALRANGFSASRSGMRSQVDVPRASANDVRTRSGGQETGTE